METDISRQSSKYSVHGFLPRVADDVSEGVRICWVIFLQYETEN